MDCNYDLYSFGSPDYPVTGLDFYETYVYDGYYGTYYYYNVTFINFTYEYYGYEYDGSTALTYEGYYSTYLTASFDGSTLSWDGSIEDESDIVPGEDCGGLVSSTSTEAYPGGFTGSSVGENTLACDGSTYDAWSFDASTGDTVEITVNTVMPTPHSTHPSSFTTSRPATWAKQTTALTVSSRPRRGSAPRRRSTSRPTAPTPCWCSTSEAV